MTLYFSFLFHPDTVNEGNARPSPNGSPGSTVAASEDDAKEYASFNATKTPLKQPVTDGSEQPLLKSTDSEGSTSGSESAMGALYARIARLSKHSKDDEDNSSVTETKPDKAPSSEKTKPRPPDPSTKPKVSWIHGTSGANQSEKGPAPSPPKEGSGKRDERHRSKDKSSKRADQKSPEGKNKSLMASDPMEHINGAVQNALKKIGNFHLDKKASDTTTTKEPPKSPKIVPPNIHSEAATLLAAQLKEKTQSLNRNDGLSVGVKPNDMSTPQTSREKPTPPQKAKRSVVAANKPLIPTSTNLQKMVAPGPVTDPSAPEFQTHEKPASNGTQEGDAAEPTPKKTPIKKPPRKRGKDGTAEMEPKTTPKTAIMPPQIIK